MTDPEPRHDCYSCLYASKSGTDIYCKISRLWVTAWAFGLCHAWRENPQESTRPKVPGEGQGCER